MQWLASRTEARTNALSLSFSVVRSRSYLLKLEAQTSKLSPKEVAAESVAKKQWRGPTGRGRVFFRGRPSGREYIYGR